MMSRIRELERRAAALEPGEAERARLAGAVFSYVQQFLESLPRDAAFRPADQAGAGLLDSPISDQPLDMDAALTLLRDEVERPGINAASPGHLGYIPGGGLYHAALGDFLAAATNRYAGIVLGCPGAVRMQRQLLRWLGGLFDLPPTMSGDLTSGGSIAHLSGVVAAREARALRARDVARAVVYLTEQTHHSLRKALGVAGMKECVIRTIPLDDRWRMAPAKLAAAIEVDRAAGRIPWMVAATAGSTDTGAVDPLDQIAEIADRYDLWMQTDAAYGGAFALVEEAKRRLAGIERSDAIIVDPHKGLFMPYGSGAILVRDGEALRRAYAYTAAYLQDEQRLTGGDAVSPADLSPELTRHFRALRLWLSLKLLGVAPFRAALEEKLLLARYFHERICGMDGFEAGPPPDLSIVPFRFVPRSGEADEFNQALLRAVQHDGRVFLSSTRLRGRFMIRAAILCFRTHLEHVEAAIDVLQRKVRELEPR